MKYIISESKLESAIFDYLDKLFDVDEISLMMPLEYDEDTDQEWEDNTRIEFYLGDYDEETEDTCFRWYDCEYFKPDSPARNICPTVSVELYYENLLNSYFGDLWREPFRKWFIENFELPVKTVDN